MTDNSVSPTDFNAMSAIGRTPTPFEVIRALVEGRLLLEAFEAGEPPPEFEECWQDDLEAAFDALVESGEYQP